MLKVIEFPILAFSVVLFTACSSNDSNDSDVNATDTTLNWNTCANNDALDCATLSVPMDYSDEQAGNIEIALNRLPARQQPAQGVLLLNGGGPASSLDITELVAAFEPIPDAVRERYDTISFDPRGFGESTPLTCDISNTLVPTNYLANDEMINAFVEQNTNIAQTCLAQTGDYLLQIGSMNITRDIESIRKALAVEKLSFIGFSYGTRLGALYLQNFPDRSEHIILDASEHPDSTLLTWGRDIQPQLQQNLENMLALCADTEPGCNAVELESRLIEKMNTLLAENNQEELSVVLELVTDAAEDPEEAEILIEPLAAYLLRDEDDAFETLSQLLDSDDDDDEEDVDDVEENDEGANELEFDIAIVAVLCSDDAFRPTASDLQGYLEEFSSVSDFFAEAYINLAGLCAGWPTSKDPLPPIATSTAPASLVIGGTQDATSPIAWSEAMATAIGGYFLASSHEEHTVLYQFESDCVDDIATELLINDQLPLAGDCL